MQINHYSIDNYDDFMNRVVMIPEKNTGINGFYKIIKSTGSFFCVRKMKCQTTLLTTDLECGIITKKYQAIVSEHFDDEIYKKIKKTSINKKYPEIICSIVQYEI